MKTLNFNFELSMPKIMNAMHCDENSTVYPYAKAEYEKQLPLFYEKIHPRVFFEFHDNRCIVLMTLGCDISDYSSELFAVGEGFGGLMINTMADEYIFEMDNFASLAIKEECSLLKKGILSRNDTLSAEELKLAASLSTGVSVIGETTLSPIKSMAYILELTDDTEVFNAQHDCSKCPRKDCPRRHERMSEAAVLSDYSQSFHTDKNVLCIDIGTTTIAIEYFQKGISSKKLSLINPQRRFGADVLSRISAANLGRGDDMKKLIDYELIKAVNTLCANDKVDIAYICANTVMTHLLMGYPCTGLGKYPFTPHSLKSIHTDFASVTQSGTSTFPVSIIGGIGAFVGGDIVSGILYTKMAQRDEISLFIDLGTNGEMALGNKDKILVTSTSAGPAFEGGRISCGTGSVEGAIYSLNLKEKSVKTIGDKKPSGLCGSGIIELISQLYTEGIMDETGLLKDEYFENGFTVCEGVSITQKDIREIQTAKAAIRAGIDTLLEKSGIAESEIETVYLAGGFGSGLNSHHASVIGIIPGSLKDKVITVGNSALGGCAMLGAGADFSEIDDIIKKSKEIILGADDDFSEKYLRNMNF